MGTQNDARTPETRADPRLARGGPVVAAAAAELTRKSHLRNRAGRRVYRRFRRDVAVDLSDPPSSVAFKRARSAGWPVESPYRRSGAARGGFLISLLVTYCAIGKSLR